MQDKKRVITERIPFNIYKFCGPFAQVVDKLRSLHNTAQDKGLRNIRIDDLVHGYCMVGERDETCIEYEARLSKNKKAAKTRADNKKRKIAALKIKLAKLEAE